MMFLVRYAALFTLALNLVSHAQSLVRGDPAKPCYPGICKLSDCFCSGTEIPGNLSVSSIPQIACLHLLWCFCQFCTVFLLRNALRWKLKEPKRMDVRGGYSIYPCVGRCGPAPHTLTLFKTKIADFPALFKAEFRFLIPCLRHS